MRLTFIINKRLKRLLVLRKREQHGYKLCDSPFRYRVY